ncbi:MAG: methionine adenosyltransferase [Actinomycetaceae bacterium]|nr:methionine adenosyltransferase [Actinomycetaceae bacterium]
MKNCQLFTSESVTAGHPDKVADRISDTLLDAALKANPQVRAAIETMVTTNRVIVAGEVSGVDELPVEELVRAAVADIGYNEADTGFCSETLEVSSILDQQSNDIAQSVDRSFEARELGSEDLISAQGAGDQGIMFGYACDETAQLMPLPIALAHSLAQKLEDVRCNSESQLRPDGKTQVTVQYENGVAKRLDTVVVSTQHAPQLELPQIRSIVEREVVAPVLEHYHLAGEDVQLLINPSGRFVHGGPSADTGLTGRKIIVDTYGGFARHGGGAFSGKDATKVDRSASYAMRWVAKNLVAAGLAKQCELQVAYAIGRAEPVGLWINTYGTATVPEDRLLAAVRQVVDLRPRAIIDRLRLTEPGFAPTAAYGHFGRPGFTWENLDLVEDLQGAVGD